MNYDFILFGCYISHFLINNVEEKSFFSAHSGLKAKLDRLKLMGPVILNSILKSLDGYSGNESGQSM